MQAGPVSTESRSHSPSVRAVILDYGKVLARCPTVEEFGRMAKMFNVSFESFLELWESSRNLYDRGDITADEYWLRLAAKTNTSLDPEQIKILRQVEVEIWCHLYPDMLDWLVRLHQTSIKTALLSNMPLDLAAHVRANCRWMDNFTFKTLSAEVRLIKPEPAIYEHTLRGLGVAAKEALFVDDREPNLQAAQALGIHTLLFTSVAHFSDDLEALGFPILPAVTESSEEQTGQETKLQL